MLDERFSSSAFASCGLDTDEARALADSLAEEVQKEMQPALQERFADIIRQLNEMGHNLKPDEIGLGELSYRDDHEDAQGYHCGLRVALDLVVSTGYAHLSNADNESNDSQLVLAN